jgi:hypothetical protein
MFGLALMLFVWPGLFNTFHPTRPRQGAIMPFDPGNKADLLWCRGPICIPAAEHLSLVLPFSGVAQNLLNSVGSVLLHRAPLRFGGIISRVKQALQTQAHAFVS